MFKKEKKNKKYFQEKKEKQDMHLANKPFKNLRIINGRILKFEKGGQNNAG